MLAYSLPCRIASTLACILANLRTVKEYAPSKLRAIAAPAML
jgi:hypothetical protein